MEATRKGHVAMRRTAFIIVGVVGVLALPASAAGVKPTSAEKRLARAECKAERGVTRADHLEFAAEYGGRRPFRRCVRLKAREFAAERALAQAEALQACRAERAADPVEFAEDYPGADPLRQCVRMESI
jgi:hypothetical protein